MKLFAFIILFYILCPAQCNESSEEELPRIMGGDEVFKDDSFPHYHCAFLVEDNRGDLKYQCGAVIINEKNILTAAHCIEFGMRGAVRAGTLNPMSGGQLGRIRRIFVHPQFNFDEAVYDFAMLKLEKPLQFSQFIRPIALPIKNSDILEGSLTVTGWGRISEYGQLSEKLLRVSLNLVDRKTCQAKFDPSVQKITEMHICALGTPGKDACSGDSGGPLVFNHTLVGVVSFGDGCGGSVPGVYANVAKVVGWIWSVIMMHQ